MRKEQQIPIDEVFSKALAEPDNTLSFDEQNWNALKDMLYGRKKRPFYITYWRPILTSAAAIILVALGWWCLMPQTAQNANNAQQIVIKQPKGMVTPNRGQNVDKSKANELAAAKPFFPNVFVAPQLMPVVSQPVVQLGGQSTAIVSVDNTLVKEHDNKDEFTSSPLPAAKQSDYNLALVTLNAYPDSLPAVDLLNNIPIALLDDVVEQNEINEKGLGKIQLAINILGAADMNGVSSFNSAGTGKNVGLMFSARFNKFTISTGANYSYKPYAMEFSQYSPNTTYKFKNTPESVMADCRMLDIPLNIDYKLYSKSKNAISVGTGISSYIMLSENYAYTYSGTNRGVSNYQVANPGHYLFGALNFQASYQRQINSKFGINITPYIKVPLADVGYSRVRLQTAGVAVGFNWNLNTLPKPK